MSDTLTPNDSETTLTDAPIDAEDNVCTPEHCFYAFDTLYCELTGDTPIKPKFADEK